MAPALAVGDLSGADAMSSAAALIPDLRPADPAELPDGVTTGYRATMPMIDMPHYLDYLTQRLAAAGCEIEIHPVRSLAEAADAAPIVVNCTGLAAGALVGDDTVRPLFGQHVVVANPGLQQLFLEINSDPEWICYFPHPQRVVCGGISIPDRWDTTAEPEISERIMQRCRRIEPRLAEAEVIETITGLRPDRPSVRVEAEPLGRSAVRAQLRSQQQRRNLVLGLRARRGAPGQPRSLSSAVSTDAYSGSRRPSPHAAMVRATTG